MRRPETAEPRRSTRRGPIGPRWRPAVVIAALWASACGGDREPPATASGSAEPTAAVPTLGLESPDSLRFGQPDPEQLRRLGLAGMKRIWPRGHLYVRATALEGTLRTPRPLHLDRAYELEFLPLVEGSRAGGSTIETYVVADGRRQLLASHRAVATESGDLVGQGRFDALKRAVRIDLSAYRGRPVTVEWRLRGGHRPAAIGLPRLRPLAPPRPPRPHVLLICVDTLRWDYAFGESGRELMPRLHELAADSVTYPRASSTASWTLPSITSAMSGLYPRFHGTGRLLESGPRDAWDPDRELPPGRFKAEFSGRYQVFSTYPRQLVSLTEELQQLGYRTAVVVSNFFYVHSGLARDGADFVYDTGAVPGSLVNHAGEALLDLLGDGDPLFLLMHYMDVHQHPGWYGPRRGRDKDARYETGVRNADRFLGELLDAWRRTTGFDETLIVVFSDHGEHLEEGARRGHGNTMEEILLHVPLVVRYPKSLGVDPGEDDRVASLVDLFPTILDVAGVEHPSRPLDGRSLLRASAPGEDAGRVVFADFQLYGAELSAAREADHKLIFDLDEGTRRLLAVGPGNREREAENRAAQQAIERAFRDYVRRSEAPGARLESDEVVEDEELQERLRALGYVD